MDKDFYIECGCGYQTYFSNKEMGTTQSCFNCGAALKVEARNSTEDNAPLSQLEVKAKPEQPKNYSSPFEDEDEPDKPALPVSTNFHSAPTPKADTVDHDRAGYASATSAFGGLEEDESSDENSSATPQTDPSLIREYEGPEHSNRYRQLEETETCPRCGNVYRGEWDKQSINGEDICYICSNQATEGAPERADTKKFGIGVDHLEEGPKQLAALDRDAPIAETHVESVEKFWLFDPESDQFRIMIYSLAVGTIMITLFAVFFMDSGSGNPAEYSSPVAATDLPPLPMWGKVIMVGWIIFEYFASYVATVFLILYLTERMPHDHLGMDLLTITLAFSPLFICRILMYATVLFMGSDPTNVTLAAALAAILRIAGIVLTIMTLLHLLDFRIRDFIYMYLSTGFMAYLMSLVGLFVYAGLAQLAL